MSPPASGPNRVFVDTIYCEAKCPDEDVYYFGSDDDQYENPRERKRRYERAGQRFLQGSAPRLFSSSLRGPFESSRGWKNPWASKAKAATATTQSSELQTSQSTNTHNSVETTSRLIKNLATKTRSNKHACHLPSPQSLKTASLPDDHPYLEDEELRAVQAWRHSIHATDSEPKQQPKSAATDLTSSRKRKAGHNWLKTVPDKKRMVEPAVDNTPKSPAPTLDDAGASTKSRERITANARLPLSARLLPNDFTSQLISPPKRPQTTKAVFKSTAPIHTQPETGLSQEQQAAATLSSPVSLQNVKQEKSVTESSPLKFKTKIHSISDASSERSEPNRDTTAAVDLHRGPNIHKPYRLSDDEDFVFDIAADPLSEQSESEDEDEDEDEEACQQGDDTVGAISEAVNLEQTTSHDELEPGNDGSSDSDLTELSETPALSDSGESADESETEAGQVFDTVADSFSKTTVASGLEEDSTIVVTTEAMDTAEDSHNEQAVECDDVPALELLPTVEDAVEREDRRDADEDMDVVMSHQFPGGDAITSDSNGSQGAPEAADGLLSQIDTVESETGHNTADHSPSLAVEAAGAESERVTVEPTTESVSAAAVPPSPRVKQESSEFSLKAMLRSFVPTNTWAQITHLASGPSQSTIQQPDYNTPMEDYALPSVEVPAEAHDVATHVPSADEPNTASDSDGSTVNDIDESGQQLLSEHDSALALDKLPIPEEVGEDRASPITQEQATASEDDHRTPSDEIAPDDDTGEQNALSDKETTSMRSTMPNDTPPPATASATPVRTTTPSPAENASNSEPRFAFKSFAAFTTPSPERLRLKKRRTLPGSSLRHPSLKGIISSRKADSKPRTTNRVSWLLPGEQEGEHTGSADKATVPVTPSSPPPRTPLAELPTASNEKFSKHFSSVVKRTDGLRHRFHVAPDADRVFESLGSSQCTSSQNSNTVAKAITVDAMMKDALAVDSSDVENQSRPREATMSVEPMDMVEDMVREMGDFWQAWDVDAELNAAKKAQAEAAAQSQSAWR